MFFPRLGRLSQDADLHIVLYVTEAYQGGIYKPLPVGPGYMLAGEHGCNQIHACQIGTSLPDSVVCSEYDRLNGGKSGVAVAYSMPRGDVAIRLTE